jgi:hypothetical protein
MVEGVIGISPTATQNNNHVLSITEAYEQEAQVQTKQAHYILTNQHTFE